MRVPVSFPLCRYCHTDSRMSFHKDCPQGGGVPLEIDTNTNVIYCSACHQYWNIYDSRYYCRCGAVFEATDVKEEIDYIIKLSNQVANEIRYMKSAEERRQLLANESLYDFVAKWLNKIGTALGYAYEVVSNIVKIVKSFFGS